MCVRLSGFKPPKLQQPLLAVHPTCLQLSEHNNAVRTCSFGGEHRDAAGGDRGAVHVLEHDLVRARVGRRHALYHQLVLVARAGHSNAWKTAAQERNGDTYLRVFQLELRAEEIRYYLFKSGWVEVVIDGTAWRHSIRFLNTCICTNKFL